MKSKQSSFITYETFIRSKYLSSLLPSKIKTIPLQPPLHPFISSYLATKATKAKANAMRTYFLRPASIRHIHSIYSKIHAPYFTPSILPPPLPQIWNQNTRIQFSIASAHAIVVRESHVIFCGIKMKKLR